MGWLCRDLPHETETGPRQGPSAAGCTATEGESAVGEHAVVAVGLSGAGETREDFRRDMKPGVRAPLTESARDAVVAVGLSGAGETLGDFRGDMKPGVRAALTENARD